MAAPTKDSKSAPHWGEWIEKRAEAVGFRSQKGLALAVGCNPAYLSRILKIATAPAKMRKGLDKKLSDALKTDTRTCFVDFTAFDPTAAPIVEEKTRPLEDVRLRQEIAAMVAMVAGERLAELRGIVRSFLYRSDDPGPGTPV